MINLNAGVLKDAYDRTLDGLLRYDCKKHAETYAGTYGEMNAEPEFSGKYIDICTKYYKETKDERYLECAAVVVKSIVDNQGTDGYLGMLGDEFRWKNFSVWNQTFTVLGLLSYYEETHDTNALASAEKCGIYIAEHYMADEGADILDATNYGTQNISFLCVLPDLYKYTKNKIFYEFMNFIVDKMKNSNLNFFEFESILLLQSRKAIENFVILIGMLRYGDISGDTAALSGACKYWQQIADTQIRNTGNGSIKELWTENGNAPALLGEDMRPNETCVSVGWIELSLMLFHREHSKKYLDEIEKTLFNHLLGSLSDDGSDFAYYQPNFGNKVFSTSEDMYKCCRYRGFTLFAYLKDMLYFADENCVIPMIYHESDYEDDDILVCQHTNYPYESAIKFDITHKTPSERRLKLRIPAWCEKYSVNVSGGAEVVCEKDGYIEIAGSGSAELLFECGVKAETGVIDGKKYVSFTYGPLLLAAVTDGNVHGMEVYSKAEAVKVKACMHSVVYEIKGRKNGVDASITLTDYASAGRNDGEVYAVWIPEI